MDYNFVKTYQRNKNILIEMPKDTKSNKGLKKLLRSLLGEKKPPVPKEVTPVISERIVEYPVLFQYLDLNSTEILDFGCVEDLLPLHLCALGYSVTGMDFRPYPFTHPNFKFIQADILTWDPPAEVFDTIISSSTIEHVGLSYYGDPVSVDGDKIAVEKLFQALKKGGDLLVTLPAGKNATERGMRIYDPDSVNQLIPNIEVQRYFYKTSRYGNWQETTPENISSLVYDDYNALSPAQGVVFVKARKT